jgi:wobble nucleotide-excising tRNase
LPQIRTFNRHSIDASVFELAGKQLLPIYFLGEDSVEKQKQIEAHKIELENANIVLSKEQGKHDRSNAEFETFCTNQAKIIRELLTASGSSYNNYDKRNFKEAAKLLTVQSYPAHLLDEKVRAKLKEAKDAKPKPKIPTFQADYPNLSKLTSETQELLGQCVVSRVIDELDANQAVASWVEDGLQLHTDANASATCRFCNQLIPPARLEHLQAHFNDEFKRFQSELAAVIKMVDQAKVQVESIRLPDKSLLYEHLVGDYEKATDTLTLYRGNIVLYLNALIQALNAKKESPFKPLNLLPYIGQSPSGEPIGTLGTIFSVLMAGSATLGAIQGKDAIEKINALIESHNNQTDDFVNVIGNARKSLETCYVAEVFEEHESGTNAINSAKISTDQARKTVSDLISNITALEREIRQHHRPADELTSEIRAYLGRDDLAFVSHDSGYTITRYEQPATNLSEGERTAIAFLYFLKSLEDTSFDLRNGVVVIDDPVTSLDANSLYSAFGYMKERTKDVGQLFVLTHNFVFFRQVKNWYNNLPGQRRDDITKRPARFYMLTSGEHGGQRNSALGLLDPLLHQFESEYHYLFKCVYEEANRPAQNPALVQNYGMPNVARRILEAFLAFRFPGKANELYQQLEQVQFDPAKKSRILRFLHTHSHYGQIAEPEHDLSILTETQAVLQDVLLLIEQTDSEHYRQMLSLVCP